MKEELEASDQHIGIYMIEPSFVWNGEERLVATSFEVRYMNFSNEELHGRISEINMERIQTEQNEDNYLVKIYFCHKDVGTDVDFPYVVQFEKLQDANRLVNVFLSLFMSGETRISHMVDVEGNRVQLSREPF